MFWKHSEHTCDESCNCWQILYYQTLSSYEFVLKTLTQSSSDIITVLCSVIKTQLCSAWNVKTLIKPVPSLSDYTKSALQNTVGSFPYFTNMWSFKNKAPANPQLSSLSTKSGQICLVFKLIRYSPLDGGGVYFFCVQILRKMKNIIVNLSLFCPAISIKCIIQTNLPGLSLYSKKTFGGFS